MRCPRTREYFANDVMKTDKKDQWKLTVIVNLDNWGLDIVTNLKKNMRKTRFVGEDNELSTEFELLKE